MIDFFVRHPTAGNLIMMFLLALGLGSLSSVQRETYPDFSAGLIEVRIPYPGASALEVEDSICQLIEDQIDQLEDIVEITCDSREGIAIARMEVIEEGDASDLKDRIQSAIDGITQFPNGIEIPVVIELERRDRVASIALTGDMSVSDLKAYAEKTKLQMQALPLISQVEIQGFSDHQLKITLNAATLLRHNLSMADIAQAIKRQGIDLPSGGLETQQQNYLIRFTDKRRTPETLSQLIVTSAKSGAEMRLEDIAEITEGFELEETKIFFNGQGAAILSITKTNQQDTITVMSAVKEFLQQQRAIAPPSVSFHITRDNAASVTDRLSLLMRNGLQGLLLAFLTMWLFFHGRFAFWVAMGLPVSFLGALYFMTLMGLTVNMITMVALLIAIGLLMDDAIVIAENIANHLRLGKTPTEAAIDGVKQVTPGVVASFLTSISVFLPLAFLSGHLGKVLQFIPIVLIMVLAVSLIEAFLILPHHLAKSLEKQALTPSRFRDKFEQMIDKVRRDYVGKAVDLAVTYRYLFVGSVIALFMVSIGMLVSGHLKFQSFPDLEGDVIEARLLMPQGTPLWKTEAIVKKITDALEEVNQTFSSQQPEGQSLIKQTLVTYNNNPDANESGTHIATVTVELLSSEIRKTRLFDVKQYWREAVGEVPDAILLSFKEPRSGPGGIALEIRLSGDQLDQLKLASAELQTWFQGYDGVYDLSDDLRAGKPEIHLTLKAGAVSLGLTAADISQQLRDSFYGVLINEIQYLNESYEINVQLSAADQDSLLDFEDFRITTSDGRKIPLSALVNIEEKQGYARIQRINGQRSLTMTGELDTRIANAREIITHTKQHFLPSLSEKYPDIHIGIEGQSKRSAKTGGSMLKAFGLGLLGVFILLSYQFRNYSEPLIVMALIPMAMIGVVWGHLAMGLHLTMPGLVGFASLAGIVVNDSILLVEFLKLRVREGYSHVEAAKLASRERFRAVLLTSVTTIAGLTPLLLERSLQAQILVPLATSIIFGLLATTLLVLFFIPAIFSILNDFGLGETLDN